MPARKPEVLWGFEAGNGASGLCHGQKYRTDKTVGNCFDGFNAAMLERPSPVAKYQGGCE
jgi:hypothetical protein